MVLGMNFLCPKCRKNITFRTLKYGVLAGTSKKPKNAQKF
jgi:hypothetical protein